MLICAVDYKAIYLAPYECFSLSNKDLSKKTYKVKFFTFSLFDISKNSNFLNHKNTHKKVVIYY